MLSELASRERNRGERKTREAMERSTPVRKPHTSTADLLIWSPTDPPPPSASHSLKPASGISPVMFGAQPTEEEAESLNLRKPCSGSKLREITGSGIFAADNENGASECGSAFSTPNSKTGLRIYQQAVSGISQITFSADESVSPKKPTSQAEVAKQRELIGTLESEDAKIKKQLSDAKCKELSGHDIFGPPPEVPTKPLAARNLELKGNFDLGEPAPRSIHTSVKVSNPCGGPSNILFGEDPVNTTSRKLNNQKFAELNGNAIFQGDAPFGSAEKPLSVAKLREMNGSDIFADGKASAKDYLGGVRKPPGGESSIALV